ncbi:DUF1707 SHOCT-like domain-containing protein [Mycolicibacterium brumae]|uniref:DUF1707 domain-containing protein n=1 Tax=Mycolicibacterium brumae TaxID=85968 RepID=A0A2G5P4X4_9MYCO|nr:DUF1707 domain-containing protein [Mycolicibacterium brumae]MCV7192162.1 DUF1707 domain-containing protein [Mycolicibacterium brumae]PIB73345.1 DUF1707 domain-containing protein [Mycolicibacterium brumae]RWA21222.1 hypothetical protein MBRU_14845 [Mycolicibacterium brumae DSM 44177]UWW10681.1 DUF1707 domain-containing protein [Mycolicibacterium brumae]
MTTRQTARTRAKDADRDDTCKVLDSALADGQLSGMEHAQRVKAATTAATLGDLQALTDDLQTGNAPVKLPNLRPASRLSGNQGWGLRAAVAGVLVVLGIGIGWGLYGNTSSPLSFTSDPGAKSDGIEPVVLTPPRQLHSLGGLNGLFEQMRQRFGDTVGYRMVVYPDYASLDRPDPAEPRRVLNYTYRGGWDDSSSSARTSEDQVVDLAKFDVEKIVGVLRGAPETLGMQPGDVKNTYLIIGPSGDAEDPESVEISVYASGDYGSGYIELAPDARVKRISYP